MMSSVPTVDLPSGIKMPILGFGVFQMNDEEAENSVITALQTGYRSIDTAASYNNEQAVGRAIKKSGIPRNDIFITSKLWIADASYQKAKQAYQTSLDKLGLEYLDLYLIHQPFGDIFGAWKALLELYQEGKIRAIGVSNFNAAKLTNFIMTNRKILNVDIIPMINQIETNPFNQEVDTRKVMKEYNIAHEGWAPFAEGQHEIFSNSVLDQIAKKYNKSISQVVLRWHVQSGVIAIPKSTHQERIAENFDIFDFELTSDDMLKITELDTNQSLVDHENPAFVNRLFDRIPSN